MSKVKSVAKFTKEQLKRSDSYADNRDILEALLKDNVKYSHEAVRKLIDEFLKVEVK